MTPPRRLAGPLTVVLTVAALTGLAGAIGLFAPLDDMRMAVIDRILSHKADGQTAIIAVDPTTLNRLNGSPYPRRYDAMLIDKLERLGAGRIYFDRVFSHQTHPEDDRILQRTLMRHHANVFLGQLVGDAGASGFENVQPNPMFKAIAAARALNGQTGPFALDTKFPFRMAQADAPEPIAVSLARRHFAGAGWYRPDLSIAVASIPSFSMADILDGKVPRGRLAGKDVVIGMTAKALHDFHRLLGQGYVPGVYFHAMAAQTLRQGTPQDWGWLPAWALGAILAGGVAHVNRRRVATASAVLAGCGFVALPVLLQRWLITLDVVPGALAYLLPALYIARLRHMACLRAANNLSGLPSIEGIKSHRPAPGHAVIAMKIINYDQIAVQFSQSPDSAIFPQLADRLRLGQSDQRVFQDHRTLVWMSPITTASELAEHLEGLAYIAMLPVRVEGRQVDIVAAVGADMTLGASMTTRISHAMAAAHQAQRNGEKTAIYTDGLSEAEPDLGLMSQLDAAVDAGQLWLAFQPKVDLPSGEIVGAEGLIRWSHPTRGEISPADFIPVAEEQNRMAKLSLHVLGLAVQALEEIRAAGLFLQIAINISAKLITNADFTVEMMRFLLRNPITRNALTIEITETTTLDQNVFSTHFLRALQHKGIRLSIDDYGTGNATLSYLAAIPADEVKIDRKFITRLDSDITNQIVVESTIEMAHQLNRKVVAEGVERPEEIALLQRMGCDQAQGYLIAKPMPLTSLIETISTKKPIRMKL